LESFVTKVRDKKAALKFLRKAMRKHGRPESIITDRLRSYGAALKESGALGRQTGTRPVNVGFSKLIFVQTEMLTNCRTIP
jgi:putative transposase